MCEMLVSLAPTEVHFCGSWPILDWSNYDELANLTEVENWMSAFALCCQKLVIGLYNIGLFSFKFTWWALKNT